MAEEEKILVTGATGMVGAHVVSCLLARGMKVRAMKRETSDVGFAEALMDYYGQGGRKADVEWVTGDVTDRFALAEAMEDVKTVYHCASMMSFDKGDREAMWDTNVEGTGNVVEVAHECGVDMICHLSYMGAIGHTTDGSVIDEMTAYQPDDRRSAYAQSKFRQEMEVWRGVERGMKAVVVNPGIVIGPHRGKMNAMDVMAKVRSEQTGFVDARDLAEAMVRLVEEEKTGERYIVVSDSISARRLREIYASEGVKTRERKGMVDKLKRMVGINDNKSEHDGSRRMFRHDKIKNAINIEFRPLEQSVANEVEFGKRIDNNR